MLHQKTKFVSLNKFLKIIPKFESKVLIRYQNSLPISKSQMIALCYPKISHKINLNPPTIKFIHKSLSPSYALRQADRPKSGTESKSPLNEKSKIIFYPPTTPAGKRDQLKIIGFNFGITSETLFMSRCSTFCNLIKFGWWLNNWDLDENW